MKLVFKIIGIRTGFAFHQTNLNNSILHSEFDKQFEGYQVEIPEINYENGDLPISRGFNVISLNIGLVGIVQTKTIKIVPYLSYLNSLTRDSYSVYANFKRLIDNETFVRYYSFQEKSHNGFKARLDLRYAANEFLNFGFRTEDSILKSKGLLRHEGEYIDGTIVMHNSTQYSRLSLRYMFGLNTGVHLYSKKQEELI